LVWGSLIAAALGLTAWMVWPHWQAYRHVGPLVAMLKDDNVLVRVDAARKLAKLGAAAKKAIPALIESLNDEDFNVRWRAATALGEMGSTARASVPALAAALKNDTDPYARSAAVVALQKIDPDATERARLK
jgi:HEAT repeat protein